MIEVIGEKEIVINGETYIETTYNNGTVVTELKSKEGPEPESEQEERYDDIFVHQLDMAYQEGVNCVE
ncbi:MAG: hypothetical protein UDB11_03240 [Peptococcaceae bacterium]|nr:hypothetical protein [Peptococcaceae bacterium]